MKRKILDIHRLKIGGLSKAGDKALRDHLAPGVDSPPPTPKSVRPLDAHTDRELRSACAFILENYRPSHIIYQEPSATNLPVEHAAVKDSVPKGAQARPPPLSIVGPRKAKPLFVHTAAEEVPQEVDVDEFHHAQDITTKDQLDAEQELRPPMIIARNKSMTRAHELMSGSPPPKATASVFKARLSTHSRSTSNPIPWLLPPTSDTLGRPRTAPRTDSVDTSRSSPETDATDGPWSDKVSTAMTSAFATPACSSKRTSSQAPHTGSEPGSGVPKVETINAAWMRQKLEKHKQSMREQQERAKREETATEAGQSPAIPPPPSASPGSRPVKALSIARVPLPTSRLGGQQQQQQDLYPPRTDSRRSSDQLRPDSKQTVYFTPSASARDSNTTRPSQDNPQTEEAVHPASRAKSITREVKEHFRPSTAERSREDENRARPISRARSISRQLKDSLRPGAAFGRVKAGDHASDRAISRSRSNDSFRTTVSEMTPSDSSPLGQPHSWRPWRRQQDSPDVSDINRPPSSGSNAKLRGRGAVREAHPSPPPQGPQQPQTRSKTVNLNRELPPLPSLDKWKPETRSAEEPVSASKEFCTPTSESHEHDDFVYPRIDASSSPAATQSPTASHAVSPLFVPKQPTAPPPPPPVEARNTSLDMFDHSLSHADEEKEDGHHSSTPDAAIVARTLSTRAVKDRKERPRSRTTPASASPELGSLSPPVADSPAVQKSFTPARATLITSLRAAGSVRRKPSAKKLNHDGDTCNSTKVPDGKYSALARTTSTRAHALPRNPNGHNPLASHPPIVPAFLQAQADQEAYARMYDAQFANVVEISAGGQDPLAQMPAAVGEKAAGAGKEKWWSRRKRAETWMDRVVQSGSKRGMILTDEVAGGPIVRY